MLLIFGIGGHVPSRRFSMSIGRMIQFSTWPCLQTVWSWWVPWPVPPTLLSIMYMASASEPLSVARSMSMSVTMLSCTEFS